jgi:hypothetical protein
MGQTCPSRWVLILSRRWAIAIKKCGCFVIPKVSFALDSCPENKWKESQDGWNERFDEIMKKTEEDTITNSAK